MKIVYPKEEVCMACRLCEVACITEHSRSKDTIKAYKKEKPAPLSRTLVEEIFPGLSVSVNCRHCSDAPCIEACITGAMHRKPDGRVVVNEYKCVGCWMCVMACPFGAIKRNQYKIEGQGARGKGQGLKIKLSSKCDLCPDRSIPACVEACPNRVMAYEERN
ncbi:MAG: 4Fe-4S dicluster domain-containing protein [Nitrospinae bacterium]|nr:4Fe-4S dicluster domain-containing protein [Nitrospinota bacterium]